MKKILFVCSIILLLSGCGENFLDTEPLTQKVNTNFYKTPSDIQSALMGIYSVVAPEDVAMSSFIVSELMSGERLPGGGPDDQAALAVGQFRNHSNDMYLSPWSRNYAGIFRANMLLSSLEQVAFNNEQQADKAEGEARFLRAYFYFDLAKMFGTAPLVLKTEPENLPKASADELFAQIAEDLKIAIEKLPATAYTTNDIGRTTKWAAEGYMARVFLFYTGMYKKESLPLPDGGSITKQQVISYVDDCIANSGRTLVSEFRNLWPYSYNTKDYAYAKDNDLSWVGEEGGNTEVIFSIRYSSAGNWDYPNMSNQMVLFFGWRAQDQVPFGQGWGWGPVSPLMWNDWPDSDLRKKGSICDVNDDNEGISGFDWGGDNQQHETGLWQKKYIPINEYVKDKESGETKQQNISMALYGAPTDFMLNNTQETVLLRLADVLLMGAELGSTKQQEYLDRVRSRVNLPSIPVTLENIKRERRFELAFEGIRYYDLLRWGDAEKEINKLKNIPVKSANKDEAYSTKFRPETKGFLPIPNSQIQLSNGVLVQNEGWEQ